MTATNHATTGAVIALAITRPLLAIPLAFLSHFVLDAIPHYGPAKLVFKRFINFLAGDALLAIIITAAIAMVAVNPWLVIVCAAAAASPDLVWAKYIKALESRDFKALDPLSKIHQKIQRSETPRGIYIEIAWLVGLLISVPFLAA